MGKYSVILFDADNTLFDYDKAEKVALINALKRNGIEYEDYIHNKYREINGQLWLDYEKALVTKDELQTKRFEELFKIMKVARDTELFNKDYMDELGNGIFLMDEAEEVCKILSTQCKLIIVTNGISETQKRRLENSALKAYINDMIISEDTGYQKPQLEFFDYTFKKIGEVDRDKILLVGDSLTADIQGGINANITTCWYNPRLLENTNEIKSDFEIHKLSELLELMLENN